MDGGVCGGGRGGVEECRVGLGGAGCRREKRGLYVGLYVDSREIKDVCECIDESVFSFCVYSTGALCLPDSGEESVGDEIEELGVNFFYFFFNQVAIRKSPFYVCFCDLFCGKFVFKVYLKSSLRL